MRLILRWFRLLCICICFCYYILVVGVQLATASCGGGSVSKRVVTSLPGFHGRLPFHLETGYVAVDKHYGTELFYYFIQSEASSADEVPFLLWLTGGHRCSVLSGLAFEIGPIRFVLEPYSGTGLPRLRYDPNSWTKVAHILFVDSPVGAGFSFSRDPKGYAVGDLSSTEQLHEFLNKWFTDHPEYLANPFYIGGDSKAGKIVPFLGHKVSQDSGSSVCQH